MKARIITNNKCLTLLRRIPNPPLNQCPNPQKISGSSRSSKKGASEGHEVPTSQELLRKTRCNSRYGRARALRQRAKRLIAAEMATNPSLRRPAAFAGGFVLCQDLTRTARLRREPDDAVGSHRNIAGVRSISVESVGKDEIAESGGRHDLRSRRRQVAAAGAGIARRQSERSDIRNRDQARCGPVRARRGRA